MIETYLLEQFTAFARNGTLMKAAEELHITQPTLSRSMKKLEDELGVSLFHRENSRLMLNATGKVAAKYAEEVLEANHNMIDRTISFDRSLKTVSLGACAPFPANQLLSLLQEYMPEKTLSTELTGETRLLSGLRDHFYDMVILHECPKDKDLFCQRYLTEQLYITVPVDHPIADRKSITFAELKGTRILMMRAVGFWMDISRKMLQESDLIIQDNMDALNELIEASSLPYFNSDRMLHMGYDTPGRVSIPITDPEANATYWIACLDNEKKKYRSVFNAVRGTILQTK